MIARITILPEWCLLQFYVFFQNPVTVKVTIPLQPEKAEWKLAGQMLTFTLPLSESISNLKAKVQDEINMPPAKQKLFYDVSAHFYLSSGFFLRKIFLGYVLQRFKHSGLLQHHTRCSYSTASQRTWWKKKIKSYLSMFLSCNGCNVIMVMNNFAFYIAKLQFS